MDMREQKKFSAVIFDLDGLILDTEIVARRAWRQAGADFGFVLEDELYQRFIGLTTPDIENVLREVFGRDFRAEEVIRTAYGYFNEYIDKEGIAIKRGFFELFDYLNGIGFPQALATSSSRDFTERKLKVSGLLGKFDTVICGDDIENGKPAPDIFLAAAERLKVSPAECLALEDSDNGIRAAYNAGMAVIIVPDLKQPSKEITAMAYRVFSNLYEAVPFIQKIISMPERSD
jgi:beta-phosphoglucomutase-like phosphatase (HAD superfamily)